MQERIRRDARYQNQIRIARAASRGLGRVFITETVWHPPGFRVVLAKHLLNGCDVAIGVTRTMQPVFS
jgi:hypothetical protein